MLHHTTPGSPKRRVRVPATPPERPFPWLAVAGYTGLGLACLLLGALTFLFVAQPLELVRERVVERLRASLGRDLVVAGPTSLSFMPPLAVSVGNVSFAVPAASGRPAVVAAVAVERVDVELGLRTLLGGAPRITRIVLTRPMVALSEAAPGHGADGALLGSAAESGPAPQGQEARAGVRPGSPLEQMGLESVRIIDGRVRNGAASAVHDREISAINVDVAFADDGRPQAPRNDPPMAPLAAPVVVKGSFMLRGETMTLEAGVSSLGSLLGGATRVRLKLAGPPVQVAFAGEFATDTTPRLGGRLEVTAGSARALAGWLGAALNDVPDPGALHLSGTAAIAEGRMALSELEGAIGGAALAGTLVLETQRVRPYLSGTLRLAQLDLGRLLLRPGGAAPAASPAPSLARSAEPSAETASLPRANGAGAEADWSDDRIDLNALALADADLALSVDRIAYKHVTTGPSNLAISLQNRFAKMTMTDLQLYGGHGQGVVTLDGTNRTPAVGANLALEGVAALPLLRDALGFEWLEGSGSITLALAGQGASERHVVSGLNGKVAMNLANGAIRGADVAKILRGVEQGRLEGLIASAADKTQFSEFAGTFLIASGVAQNQDLRLISPRVQVSGAGSIGLARRSIDYTARARIVGGTPTPGAIVSIGKLEIPLRIEGPWSKPNVSVAGQENLAATVREIGKNLKSQEVQDAIKGLLSGDQRTKPSELIDKLFKKP